MTTTERREQAGEITFAMLARITNLGTAPSPRPMTDAEAYEEHGGPNGPLALFLEFGPCRCSACERHRAATGAA